MIEKILQFHPKSSEERAAFLQKMDEEKRLIDAEEQRLRKDLLPTINYPFQTLITHEDIVIEQYN
ncbi:MAG: hypothetical protein ACKOB7_09275 [Methylocystis sp.]